MKTIKARDLHTKWFDDPRYREAYDALDDEFRLAEAFIEARKRARLTQDELAKRMKTTQSVIARLESGRGNPSVDTLKRFALATDSQLTIALRPGS